MDICMATWAFVLGLGATWMFVLGWEATCTFVLEWEWEAISYISTRGRIMVMTPCDIIIKLPGLVSLGKPGPGKLGPGKLGLWQLVSLG